MARDRWTEFDIGPFTADTQGDEAAARRDLADMEQLRWVMEGLLEIQDLQARWPFRVVFVRDPHPDSPRFALRGAEYLLVCAPESRIPLDQIAELFLAPHSTKLRNGSEEGLTKLLGSVHADGSRVTWAGPVANPDLAWARMQLFASRFEYGASLHVLVASLRGGSSLSVAERNAFGKDPAALDQEAEANLAAGSWKPTPISGRPLNPNRDLGVHEAESASVGVYLADWEFETDPAQAEILYKQAGAAGQFGLARLAALHHQDPSPYLKQAIASGMAPAPVYLEMGKFSRMPEALTYFEKAAQLNPLWPEPVYEEAKVASTDGEREKLLERAARLDLRSTRYWIELAQLQATDGHAIEAKGSWVRAEDAASDAGERERIEQLAAASEEQRLDAVAIERQRERDAAHLDDQQAQDAESARIHAAEAKANQALEQQSGGETNAAVVPWDSTLPQRKISGRVTQVDCMAGSRRITIRDRAGKTTILDLGGAGAQLACGPQQPAPLVSVSYAVDANDSFHTAGLVLTLQIQ